MLVMYGVRKKQKCFFSWALSCFIFAVAAVLATMRAYVDQPWLTIFVADLFLILTPLMALHGLRQFQTQKSVSWKLVALVMSYSALPLVLLYTAPVHAQTFTSMACAAIFFFAAIYMLTIRQAPPPMRAFLFALFLGHGAIMLAQSGTLIQNLAVKDVTALVPLIEWLLLMHMSLTTITVFLLPVLAFSMSEKRILELVNMDQLTGLLNRQSFLERSGLLLGKSRVRRRSFCILLIDLDNFESIKERYGHESADHCLRDVAQIIRKHLRENDLPARIGSEAFAVALADLDRNQAELISYRLVEAVANETFIVGQDPIKLTASVGCIHSFASRRDLGELLKAAGKALLQAKSSGHNRFVLDSN